jgi:probable rRNA maturation factor
MLTIEISNRQAAVAVDRERMRQAAESILRDAGVTDARLSLAVVDDATIHRLNRQYLNHDYPTDVLSFLLEREGERLEGEVIASADTAVRTAAEYSWPPGDELLLYVIHGTLHLVGHDDASPSQRTAMQREERRYLVQFGLEPPREPSASE